MNLNKGLFIVVEGRDGTGKTVMTSVIGEYLSRMLGIEKMELTKEPGSWSVDWNQTIREMIFDEDIGNIEQGLLFFIDHYRHAEWVKRKIEEGVSVISDRWLFSQYAYQIVKEDKQEDALFLYKKYEELQIKPDLVFILDCNWETTEERLKGRKGKDISQKDKDWGDHDLVDAKMRDSYRDLYNKYKGAGGFYWIGQDSESSPQEVFKESIKPEIDRFLEDRKSIKEWNKGIEKIINSTRNEAVIEGERNRWLSMPKELKLYNGNILCDSATGPCSCGATHNIDETVERIRALRTS